MSLPKQGEKLYYVKLNIRLIEQNISNEIKECSEQGRGYESRRLELLIRQQERLQEKLISMDGSLDDRLESSRLVTKPESKNTELIIVATHQLQYYDRCPISYDDIKIGDSIIILGSCGHWFSKKSFKLFQETKSCPLCRKKF